MNQSKLEVIAYSWHQAREAMTQLVLVLLLIGWKSGANLLSQSRSVVNAKPITFRHSNENRSKSEKPLRMFIPDWPVRDHWATRGKIWKNGTIFPDQTGPTKRNGPYQFLSLLRMLSNKPVCQNGTEISVGLIRPSKLDDWKSTARILNPKRLANHKMQLTQLNQSELKARTCNLRKARENI